MRATLRATMRAALLSLAAAGFSVSCGAPAPDLEEARRSLLETDQAWAATVAAGEDLDAIVSYWAEDAVVYPPDEPAVEGRPAIREYVASALAIPGFQVSWEVDDVVVGPSGRMAYATGRNHMTMPDPDGNLVTVHGKGVTVWRREDDGSWKCVVDIWNAAGDANRS